MLAKTLSFTAGLALAVLAASPSGAAPATVAAPVLPGTAAPQKAAPPSAAVFPTRINPKYASQSAGQGRMHTCLDQYNANKAAHANGGLDWIQKGGGYYSACTKKLKG